VVGGDTRHFARASGRRPVRPPGRRLRRRTSALVVAVLALAVASYAFDLGPRVLGWDHPSPLTEPGQVAPPPGLTLPSPVAAPVVASEPEQGAADPAEVRRTVAPLLRDEDLGPRVAVGVSSLPDGSEVFSTGPASVIPASTMKVLTVTAALAALGPDHTFATSTVAGRARREVLLVGGGDPLLARAPDGDFYPARADLVTLAKATARSLKNLGRLRVRLGYDTSLFTGPSVNPAWRASYVPENVVSRISPLWVDEGREREELVYRAADPALGAAQVFARALEREGITVRGRPRPSEAADDAVEYATVRSAPLSQIAQWTLEASDNEAAEVLLRHVGLATGRPGSFTGGAAGVREVLGALGVDLSGTRILDGSGLSRKNRLTTAALLSAMRVAASEEHPELRTAVTGLPVAGFTGSLTYRFNEGAPAGLGRVRAKTGTLTGVHGLAGVLTDRDGTVLAFVAIADQVKVADTLDAREQLDRVAAALAACRCGA
jgi:D-alanyl-D-alanine carboxypeptidase/D-alanyl-D-alanine-endopeptidase (penicillin-binding protein 4)